MNIRFALVKIVINFEYTKKSPQHFATGIKFMGFFKYSEHKVEIYARLREFTGIAALYIIGAIHIYSLAVEGIYPPAVGRI